jgi:hypothetical protein
VNERSSCSCGYLHATSSSTGAAQYRLRHCCSMMSCIMEAARTVQRGTRTRSAAVRVTMVARQRQIGVELFAPVVRARASLERVNAIVSCWPSRSTTMMLRLKVTDTEASYAERTHPDVQAYKRVL